jgi:hypothetical protein
MATRKSNATEATSVTKRAGKPAGLDQTPSGASRGTAAASGEPSAAELDARDRIKSGPRRPAGPPLTGDIPSRSAIDALTSEILPPPTDPQ